MRLPRDRVLPLMIAALLAAPVLAQDEFQPPPPPSPPEPQAPSPSELPPVATPELQRYQACLQKMLDAGAADNMYMRRCLGLSDKPARRGDALAGVSEAEIKAVAQKGEGELRGCYDLLLAATKDLGITPEGQLQPRFDLTPSGKIENVTFPVAKITDASFIGCVKNRLQSWAFPKSVAATEKVTVQLGFLFTVKPPRTASVSQLKSFPRLSGPGYELAPDDILSVFRRHVGKIRRCYDDLVKRKPGAGGEAAVSLQVGADGRVRRVTFRRYTLGDSKAKTCLSDQVKSWRFPKPRSGSTVTVSYPPFVFNAQPPQ